MSANHEEAYQLACMKRGESNLALAYIDIGEENARLREELAAAQVDAKRYRWLRENLNNTEALEELYKHPGDIPTAEQFDEAIDEAIRKEKTE